MGIIIEVVQVKTAWEAKMWEANFRATATATTAEIDAEYARLAAEAERWEAFIFYCFNGYFE